MEIDPDSAQVRVPPPLAVLAAILVSWIVHLIHPIPVFHESINGFLGSVLFASGLLLALLCVGLFKAQGTGLPPWKPSTKVVHGGPYRFSRNPIYIGLLIAYLGVIVLINTVWGFVLLIPLFFFFNNYVIPKEEKYLESKFGDEYRAYKTKVRRWI